MTQEARLGTRVDQVMAIVRQRMERRTLTPGARLTSVRAMSAATGFSKSTVVEAYDRLAAEGVIRSRPGAGFYVAAPLAPLSLADVGPVRNHNIDPLWMLRESLSAPSSSLKPGCGWLPDSWMPEDLLRKAMRGLARAEVSALVDYAPPMGAEPLRLWLARRMAEQGVEVSPDQVLLTDSGTHAIDLICRFLLEPGDAVLVDDPSYFNFHALLRAHRVKLIGVPYTPHGPDIAAMDQILAEHRPRLYLTNSAVHNPTGATLSPAIAHRVLKLAEARDLIIIEDDIFTDFEHEPGVRMAAFDGLDRVIRVGSFSKSLSGALRCGYVVARPDWIGSLTDLRMATGMSSSPVAAALAHAVLSGGGYRRHMERVRARLQQAMAQTIRRLKAIGVTPWTEPVAGPFLWARLPHGLDAAELARKGLTEGVVFAPGNVFSPSQTAPDFVRFNVSMMNDERIYQVIEQSIAAHGGERL
jgi:DNA-binding transcriptional MocR family regulator